jgi:hypothetical protein
MPETEPEDTSTKNAISDDDLKKLLYLLDKIQFGSITLIIREGKVVQVEKNEKMRL